MKPIYLSLALVATLAACSGDPFAEPEEETTPDTGTAIDSDRTLPPGTASPEPSLSIFRSEPSGDNAQSGDGQVSGVSYDSVNDEFTVDGLAFDGDNVYSRGTLVASLNNEYAVYEADTQFNDPLSGVPVNQFTHRAIYGVSTTGNTEFAIVRTGAYTDFGFGGFIYQRNGGVTLPSTGQAAYTGVSAAVRDFSGRGGLEYSVADVSIGIDFTDFDDGATTLGDGIQGSFTNRTIFDINGTDITTAVLDRFNEDNDASLTSVPTLQLFVGPNVLDANGEITGEIGSTFVDNQGVVQTYETGTYYGILSGDDANELVGIYVVTSQPEENVTARETGGFIVYR